MKKEEFLKEFQANQQLKFHNGFQNWWTKFVFHFNDINNIVSILNSGKLYSRDKAIELNLLKVDIANDNVILATNQKVYNFARLYFGGKTPTSYNNEGLIPYKEIKKNAHCPVPVFLLFDFVKVLSLDSVWFSKGNMGAENYEVYGDINKLEELEWNYIYHRESLYNIQNARHINYCRNAEVLVRNELDIYENLEWICVRSSADKDTLLNLVDINIKAKVKDKIKIYTSDGLFHNKRLYLTEVKLNKTVISISFENVNNEEFTFNWIIKCLSTDENQESIKIHKLNSSKINIGLKNLDTSQGIHFIFNVDGNKIYDNILIDTNEVLI